MSDNTSKKLNKSLANIINDRIKSSIKSSIPIGRKQFRFKYASKHKYNTNNSSLNNKTGVYCLFCKTSGKKYVGSSTNLKVRLLRYNQPSYVLKQRASSKICLHIAKYGSESFNYYILQYSDSTNKAELAKLEQAWINNIKPTLNTKTKVLKKL